MFTLYVYGDVNMFYMVLNAVAMVFNSSMFNTSSGAGAFLIGGLVSVIVVTSRSIFHSNSDFKPAYLMTLFLFFFAGVNVKTTVQIEDIFTGTVSSVANIPMFVAAPAGIISAAANGITTAIETAFTTPAPSSSFTSLSLGSEGFLNPLRLLMSLRCDEFVCPSANFPYLARSLQTFLLHCAMPSSGFSQTAFETSPDVVGYLTGLSVAGISVYYSSTYPNGVGMDCSTEATTLNTDTANLFSGTNAKTLNIAIYQEMLKTAPGQNNPSQTPLWTTSDIQSSLTAIVNGSASQMASQSAQAYMTNMMFMDSLENTFKCSSSAGTVNSFNTCVDSIMERDALEKMKVDDSAAGSIFARTMFPAMNLLLMLFYGFSPLVALIAMMMSGGGQGFKVVFQYFLFGAWVQSWTPVAAIINYYMQLLAGQAAMAVGMANPGLTIMTKHMFYDSLGMKIALGSNMLAATPILTYALISGSVMSMTSAIGAIAGKDKVDESQGAPTLEGGNAVTQVGSHNKMNPYNTTETSGHLGTGAAMNPAFSSLSVDASQMAETGSKHAFQESQQATTTASQSIDKALTQITGKGNAYDAGRAYDEQTRNSDASTHQTAHSIVESIAKGTGMSVQDKEAISGKLEAAAQAGVNLAGLFGLGKESVLSAEAKKAKSDDEKSVLSAEASARGSLGYDHTASDTLSRKIDQNIQDSSNEQDGWQRTLDHSRASGSGQHFKQTLDDKLGKTESEKFGKTITAVNSSSVNYEKAEGLRASIGVNTRLNGLQLMDAAASNPEYANNTTKIDQLAKETGQSGILDNYRNQIISRLGVSPDADAQTKRRAYEVGTVLAANQLSGEIKQLGSAPILNTANPGIARNFDKNQQIINQGETAVSGGNDMLFQQAIGETKEVIPHVGHANSLRPGAAAAAGAKIQTVADGSQTNKGAAPTHIQQTEKFREEGHDVSISNLNPSGVVGTVAGLALPGEGDRSKQAGAAQDNDWGNMDNGITTSPDGPDAEEPGLIK